MLQYLPKLLHFFQENHSEHTSSGNSLFSRGNVDSEGIRGTTFPCYFLMLQDIGRVATPKLVPRNCLRYLLLIMGTGELVSKFMSGIV